MHDRPGKPVVLIVDDHYRSLQSLTGLISRDEFTSVWVADTGLALKALRDQKDRIRIIIIDQKSSGIGGGGFLHQARKIAATAAVFVTGPLNPFLYYRGNFYDFSGVNLKQNINSVLYSIIREMDQKGDVPSGKRREEDLAPVRNRFGPIIGQSRGMNEIYRLIENLKTSPATVLIQGESGTGKELVARTLHETGIRKHQPFVAINCGAIPGELMESELFGHERGAFTTAVSQRKGKFELAHGGTLFLDEIGELDRNLQVKLLRVLQEREFQRVGGNRTYNVDVRIIAATSREMKKAVETGQFRNDLYYRLNVVPIHIPPLREREEDVFLLLEYFFRKTAESVGRSVPALTREAREALFRYPYPGNIRELINIVERLFIFCRGEKITSEDLPEEIVDKSAPESGAGSLLRELPETGVRLQEMEKELILKTLEKTDGNKQAAAKMLGITRRLLYLRLSRYGLSSA